MLLKVDCLPNAVVKQPSIPLIYLGRKWTLNCMMMMMTVGRQPTTHRFGTIPKKLKSNLFLPIKKVTMYLQRHVLKNQNPAQMQQHLQCKEEINK